MREGLGQRGRVRDLGRVAGLRDLGQAIAGARAVQAVRERAHLREGFGVREPGAQLLEASAVLAQADAVFGQDLLEVQRSLPVYLRSS